MKRQEPETYDDTITYSAFGMTYEPQNSKNPACWLGTEKSAWAREATSSNPMSLEKPA